MESLMDVLLDLLTKDDCTLALSILGGWRKPDLEIMPDGTPYLYRWHVTPHSQFANVYLHVQVASDPARPLHDHPWDNMGVILSGGYEELVTKGNPCECVPDWY